MPRLRVEMGGDEQVIELTGSALTMGRSTDNDLVVRDGMASRKHCRIEHGADGYSLVDLESRNGTKVNGSFVNHHTLKTGDRIEIGKATIIYEEPALAAPAAPAARREAAPAPRVHRRHARATSSLLGPIIAGLLIIAAVVVGLVLFRGSDEADLERKREWDKAQRYYKKGNWAKAQQLYEQIAAKGYQETPYRFAREKAEECAQKLKDQELLARLDQEREELRVIREFRKVRPNDLDRLRELIEQFRTDYPTSLHLPELEEMLTTAAALDEQPEEDLEQLRLEVKAFEADSRWGAAVDRIDTFLENASFGTESYKEFSKLRGELIQKALDRCEAAREEADSMLKEGDYDAAIQLYRDLLVALQGADTFTMQRENCRQEIARIEELKQ